jgi:hypothetical protein
MEQKITTINSSAIIEEFRIAVGTEFDNIDARILPPLALKYASKRQLVPVRLCEERKEKYTENNLLSQEFHLKLI